MDLTSIGAALTAVGVLLTIWAIWYARNQSKKLSDIHRNEMISLWAHLDRIRTLLMQMQKVISFEDKSLIKNGVLTPYQEMQLSQIAKGLCDEYVRVAELVVKKTPSVTIKDVEEWTKIGRIKTDWQRQQFLNLITLTDDKSRIK